jgi:uncharacterized protein (DUF1330 family)
MIYALLNVTIRDPACFGEYVRGHLPSIALYGGRVLFRSNENERVEGTWGPRLLVIHEWPTESAFHEWYGSDAYRPWKAMRHLACDIDLVLMKGMRPGGPS